MPRLSRSALIALSLWVFSGSIWAGASCPVGVAATSWNNCVGEMLLDGGRIYKGPFSSGRATGRGEVVFPNGYRYRGDVEAGKFHGFGVLLSSDGRVLQSGEWSSGSFLRSASNRTLDRLASGAVKSPEPSAIQTEVASISGPATIAPTQRPSETQSDAHGSQALPGGATPHKIRPTPQSPGESGAFPVANEIKPSVSVGRQGTSTADRVAVVSGSKRALVVGNDSYKSVPPLVNARADAEAVGSSLKALGYQVTIQLDLDEKSFKKSLRDFKEGIRGGDEVVFFFAGHGVQIGSANYLLPIDIQSDSEEQVRDESIALQRVLDDFSEQKARFSLAMIDACRDNPFKSSTRRIGARGLATTQAANGQMVIFSAGTGQQALDKLGPKDTERNGLFTRVFLREMSKPGVPIDRVMKNVRSQVHDMARSVGHDQVPAIYDQVVGDFYFSR